MNAGETNPKVLHRLDRAVHAELVGLLFGSPAVPLINGLVALVTAGVLWHVFPRRISCCWLIISLCIVLARLALWSRFKKLGSDSSKNVDVWARRFTMTTAMAGCFWGSLAATALVAPDPLHYVFAAFVVGGLCAGAAIRLSPHPPAFYSYIITSASPMVVTLLLHREIVSFAMSGLLLTFAAVMILVGRESHQRLGDYIRLKIEQEWMNADLTKATRDLTEQIAEKERIAAALEESSEGFRAIAENALDAIIISDSIGSVVYWNSAAERTFGFKADEAVGRSIHSLVAHPEAREIGERRYMRFAETGEGEVLGKTIRLRAIRKDGSEFPADLSVSRMNLGGHWHSLGIVRDVSDGENTLSALRLRESELETTAKLLQIFVEHAPVALAMFDQEMRYLSVSRRWAEDFKTDGRAILGKSHYEVNPAIPEHWKEAHRRGIAGETLKGDEECFDSGDGVIQWVRWEVVPWRASDGSVGGIVLFVEDITPQKRTEERLQQAASVFTHAREGILITDENGLILDVNGAFSQITGYSREEVLGHNPRFLKSALQSADFYRHMWRSLRETGQWSGEIWNRRKNGDIYAEMLNIGAISNGKEVLRYVGLFSDVTELKNKQQQLERIAHFDVLTGLPNRVLFADRLRQAIARAHRHKHSVAVAYIDLDEFKQINDSYGHVAGDELLKLLARRMEQSLRESDTLARLGGDEFVALLLDLPDTQTALPIVGRVLAAASKPIEIGTQSLHVSASVGLAFYPQPEDLDADQLLRRADQAMYQAKLAGKNRYHIFDPVQDVFVRGRYESLEQIRSALAKGHFVLHYQPKVNMRSGAIIGAEALLRLQHPERGLLSPDKFLPAIEDHPLGIAVGEWVIDNVLGQIEKWEAIGLSLPVSVNVSSSQLQDPAFVDRLRALFRCHRDVDPSRLELEVLETSALRDLAQTSEVLEACHQMGVGIALDDFGTGYSSLSYLKRLPARTLKIDRSFVGSMLESPEDRAIIKGVLGLASVFDRRVVAEGVESSEHGVMLLEMGCELAQGYSIARPMPPAQFQSWAESWRPDSRWADTSSVALDDPIAAG